MSRIVLDLESEVMSLGSIPTRGNILSLGFFHVVKPLMPILALLPSSSRLIYEKLDRDLCLNRTTDTTINV